MRFFIIIFLFFASLRGQWALWNNPSLPVGSADKGVGLWAGQTMLTVDNLNQYIDWWHEVLPGSGETFDHEGSLTSVILSPALTIGLSNYWNVSISQIVGNRTMVWEGDTTTIHHRNEGSHTNFINALMKFVWLPSFRWWIVVVSPSQTIVLFPTIWDMDTFQ